MEEQAEVIQGQAVPRTLLDIDRELVGAHAFAGELNYLIASYTQEVQRTYSKISELKAEREVVARHSEEF